MTYFIISCLNDLNGVFLFKLFSVIGSEAHNKYLLFLEVYYCNLYEPVNYTLGFLISYPVLVLIMVIIV